MSENQVLQLWAESPGEDEPVPYGSDASALDFRFINFGTLCWESGSEIVVYFSDEVQKPAWAAPGSQGDRALVQSWSDKPWSLGR